MTKRPQIVAKRSFVLESPGERAKPVRVSVRAPIRLRRHEWVCWFQIVGLGSKPLRDIAGRLMALEKGWGRQHGVDSMDAQFNALVGIHVYLSALTPPGTRLLWNGVPDTGMPDGKAERRRALQA
jgi:hypothetical protein